jgi:Protein of unknown function (DUF3293)
VTPLPAHLRAAYRRTAYEVDGTTAQIGQRSAAMEALLRRMGSRQGGFVTAWNPLSRRMPRGWNERMLVRLRAAARRLPCAEGWGRGERWAERHLLIAADPRRIAVLARRFRQRAIVVLVRARPPRLVPVRASP